MRWKNGCRTIYGASCIIVLMCLCILSIPSVQADAGLYIDPLSGERGQTVRVTIDLPQYYYDQYLLGRNPYYTEDQWQGLAGLRYAIIWNFDSSDQSNPEYWSVLGYTTIDSFGRLDTTFTVPDVEYNGVYDIAAVYEHNDVYFYDWWDGTFTVTGERGTPGFDVLLVVGALALFMIWKKKSC